MSCQFGCASQYLIVGIDLNVGHVGKTCHHNGTKEVELVLLYYMSCVEIPPFGRGRLVGMVKVAPG